VPLRRVVLRWSAKRLLDVEQHDNGGDNDDIQEQPDNGDRVVGIACHKRAPLTANSIAMTDWKY
jgi:hypothetical protein